MAKPFYERLKKYYEDVAKVLKGEADAASIFPNTSDVGMSREKVYLEFLKQHLPSKCNIFFGGFLFGEDGDESKQLDVIISTDTTPRYDFYNNGQSGKSFGPVEGCLGVASIKSFLDKKQLEDSLNGIASIPLTKSLERKVNPNFKINNYDDWPYKIVYASDGLDAGTIMNHITNFYAVNVGIPIGRRPDIIHVVGKYAIFRMKNDMEIKNSDGTLHPISVGNYHTFITEPDIYAIVWTLDGLQRKASASNQIMFKYDYIINNIK